MAVTTKPFPNSKKLSNYSEALKRTRTTYLHLLEQSYDSQDEQNKIWYASFVLQYMIANHKKYTAILESLTRYEGAEVILRRLFVKLTVDPTDNLQGYIDELQKFMEEEAFKSDIAALGSSYNRGGYARLVVAALLLAAMIPLCVALGPLVGGWVVLIMVVVGFACAHLKMTSEEAFDKGSNIDGLITSLANVKTLSYSLTDEYSYTENGTPVTLKKTHEYQNTSLLKESFFQSHMNPEKALNVEVQEQFNSL